MSGSGSESQPGGNKLPPSRFGALGRTMQEALEFMQSRPAAAPAPLSAEETTHELHESDRTLPDGQPVYSLLAEDGEDADETSSIDRSQLSEDLIAANLRLERELQVLQRERRLNPSFEGETAASGEENKTNRDFDGTLALDGVKPEEERAGGAETPGEASIQKARFPKIDSPSPASSFPASAQSSPTAAAPGFQPSIVKSTKHVHSGGTMADLSGYKDLSQAPFTMGESRSDDYTSLSHHGETEMGFDRQLMNPQHGMANAPVAFPEMNQDAESEFSGNVKTLIRLVNELPEGVTKQTGAQIIRLTMEAMGISMEDVLSEAQSAQSEMLDAVRANIKKIEEYKTVIRKLETDIRFYQGKANELSEIIDLFILSNTSGNKVPSVDDLSH